MRIALIPAYEPDNKLIKLVEDLNSNNFKVIVVNDGSNSEYNKVFNSIKDNCILIEYSNNQGKGHALKEGFKYVKNNYKNYVLVTMDCDGQHKVSDAIKLCEYIENHPKELAIGKRIRKSNTPIRSKIGNAITKVVYDLASGVSVYDTQTGLRCFSNELIDFKLGVKGERFEYEMNTLLEAPRNNINIKEIQIETIYIDNNSKSHFKAFRDSFRIYKEIFKFSLSSIISFVIDYLFYIVFMLTTSNIIISNIFARSISSIANYTINRELVFKSKNSLLKSLIQYFGLVIIILLLNTVLLNSLVWLGLNPYISKILVEIMLFIVSWYIQKKKIFRKDAMFK